MRWTSTGRTTGLVRRTHIDTHSSNSSSSRHCGVDPSVYIRVCTNISKGIPYPHIPIFEAPLRYPSVEGGLPTLEPGPLGALPSFGPLVALAASLSRAGTDTPAHSLPVSSGALVGPYVVQPERGLERRCTGSSSRSTKPTDRCCC